MGGGSDDKCRQSQRIYSIQVSELRMNVENLPQVQWVADGLSGRLSQTGLPYYALKTMWCISEEQAIDALETLLKIYAHDKIGTLYWRKVPEIQCWDNGQYRGYARLLITDEPKS